MVHTCEKYKDKILEKRENTPNGKEIKWYMFEGLFYVRNGKTTKCDVWSPKYTTFSSFPLWKKETVSFCIICVMSIQSSFVQNYKTHIIKYI